MRDLSMKNHAELEALFAEHGYTDFKWMKPKETAVGQWVRLKCMFGCAEYGRTGSCPPNVPSVAECRKFFNEYRTGIILHFEKKVDKPEDRHSWSKRVNQKLLKLERAVFLAGFEKTFLLFMDSCCICVDCPGVREECKHPHAARPWPEAMAVDVFATVRRYGYPIEVLSDYSQVMHRYAFLLIE
jgi:predicted metal-binding protein